MDSQNTTPFNRRWVAQTGDSPVDVKSSSKHAISAVTYNILADKPIRECPNYQYVPARCRFMDNRHARIMAEIRAFQPDVVCFQEVQQEHFESLLEPDMTQLGYAGCLFRRWDDISPATFYKTNRFTLIEQHNQKLSEVIMEHIKSQSLSVALKEGISERLNLPHVVGMLKLRCTATGREFVVGNLHALWANLQFPATVLLQVCAAIKQLQKLCGQSSVGCLFFGDFNSPPWFPSYKMMDRGTVAIDEQTLSACRQEKPLPVEDVHLIDVTKAYWTNTKPVFKSAYREILGEEPAITNAQDIDGPVFSGCLDYMWFDPRFFRVDGVLETPTSAAILEHVALPSVTFPSDHICLMARFSFL